jgi:hypothetical protein
MQPDAKPIVERLLSAPSCIGCVPRLGFLNQRLGLAALNPVSQKLLPQFNHIEFRIRNSRSQRLSMAVCRARLLKTSQPVRQLPAAGAHPHEYPAAMSPLDGRFERALQTPKNLSRN